MDAMSTTFHERAHVALDQYLEDGRAWPVFCALLPFSWNCMDEGAGYRNTVLSVRVRSVFPAVCACVYCQLDETRGRSITTKKATAVMHYLSHVSDALEARYNFNQDLWSLDLYSSALEVRVLTRGSIWAQTRAEGGWAKLDCIITPVDGGNTIQWGTR